MNRLHSLTYEDGTSEQIALFEETMAVSYYDWTRLPIVVLVRWARDPTPDVDHEFAVTSVFAQTRDSCKRPADAVMDIAFDLEQPERASGFPGGPKVYRDVVHHELGHALAAKFHSPEQIAAICDCFGGDISQWLPGLAGSWVDKISEAFAESFKDVFLPRQYREWDNRTKWRLKRSHFDAFLDVIESICDCAIET